MFNVYVNDEVCNEVIINFEEIASEASEYLDDCYDYIDRAKKHCDISDIQVDSPQDYFYTITFEDNDKESMYKCERYLYALFDELECRITEEAEYEEVCV